MTHFILCVYTVTKTTFKLAILLAILIKILNDDRQDKCHNFQYFGKTSIGPKMERFISNWVEERVWIELGIYSIFFLTFSVMVEL